MEDSDVRNIIKALTDKRYKARTIKGIANEAKIEENQVISIIKSNPKLRSIAKVYPRKSKSGELLITTKNKFDKKASFLDKLIDGFVINKLG
ncbi:hypothetical protein PJV97_00100 [Aliarcobacter butzleri]|uniref:hypothetical protein n=1 Tax=Aliarcobacter butzleri TaxID=28197 RepID=UPI00263C6BE7|nr:hypothetical protein [Aliarcobacter butzleri]MDN5110737.1 hypothetical protein [Aliarcobacter butzleri]